MVILKTDSANDEARTTVNSYHRDIKLLKQYQDEVKQFGVDKNLCHHIIVNSLNDTLTNKFKVLSTVTADSIDPLVLWNAISNYFDESSSTIIINLRTQLSNLVLQDDETIDSVASKIQSIYAHLNRLEMKTELNLSPEEVLARDDKREKEMKQSLLQVINKVEMYTPMLMAISLQTDDMASIKFNNLVTKLNTAQSYHLAKKNDKKNDDNALTVNDTSGHGDKNNRGRSFKNRGGGRVNNRANNYKTNN